MSSGEMLLSQGTTSPRRFVKVPLTGGATISANASLIIGEAGLPVGAATPTGVLPLACAAAGGGLSCAAGSSHAADLGAVHDSVAVPAAPNTTAAAIAGGTVAFIASTNGLFRVELGGPSPTVTHIITPQTASGSSPHDQGRSPPGMPSTAMTAVAATHELIVCGNSAKVWCLDPAGHIQSWSWVTLPEFGAGVSIQAIGPCL